MIKPCFCTCCSSALSVWLFVCKPQLYIFLALFLCFCCYCRCVFKLLEKLVSEAGHRNTNDVHWCSCFQCPQIWNLLTIHCLHSTIFLLGCIECVRRRLLLSMNAVSVCHVAQLSFTVQKWLNGSTSCSGKHSWGPKEYCVIRGPDPLTSRGREHGKILPIVNPLQDRSKLETWHCMCL